LADGHKPTSKGAAVVILGIGVDLCSVRRMARFSQNPRFLARVFVEEERRYAFSHKDPARHLAASFAAKEAFAKAGRWGLAKVGLLRVWLHRTPEGIPEIRWAEGLLPGELAPGPCRVLVSVSHEEDMAVAVVLLEGGGNASPI
jgi:holo-[acyl-carrier protein] synthase